MGAPADYDDNTTTTAAAHCFPEPNPLVLELCASVGPRMWVNTMLEELAA